MTDSMTESSKSRFWSGGAHPIFVICLMAAGGYGGMHIQHEASVLTTEQAARLGQLHELIEEHDRQCLQRSIDRDRQEIDQLRGSKR